MILVSPWSRGVAKNYPYWREVASSLQPEFTCLQIGLPGEEKVGCLEERWGLPLSEVSRLVEESELWISVDNFLPHLAHNLKKPGIVLYGPSDPLLFGYAENINLVNRTKLRPDQFNIWCGCQPDPSKFVSPETVVRIAREWMTWKRAQKEEDEQ